MQVLYEWILYNIEKIKIIGIIVKVNMGKQNATHLNIHWQGEYIK